MNSAEINNKVERPWNRVRGVLMRGKRTRRFFKVIHSNWNVDDDDDDEGGGGGGSSNNDSAYDYDGYSYYLLCDLNLPKVLPAWQNLTVYICQISKIMTM